MKKIWLLLLSLLLVPGPGRAADYVVTPEGFDNIQELLDALGFTYDEMAATNFATYSNISNHRTIFINCASTADSDSSAAGVIDNLKQFVSEGGTIYASDWAYTYIEKGWPEMIDFYDSPKVGAAQVADARVIDSGMADFLESSTVQLDFNLSAWVPIRGYNSQEVTVYLVGATGDGHVKDKAILVGFPYGKGTVIYTGFHNEAGLGVGPLAQKVLEYMVLISILKPTADDLAQRLRDQGYIVFKENVNILNTGDTSNNYTFTPILPREYMFAAAWRDTAQYQINVTPPGSSAESASAGTSPMYLPISRTDVGGWSYNVTLQSSLNASHPFVVMVGQKIPAYPSLDVKVYPNPFNADEHDVMIFEGLPVDATIKIYTISGTLLRTINKSDSTGTYFWYIDNNDGEKIASGVYLFHIESGGQTAKGKLAIVR